MDNDLRWQRQQARWERQQARWARHQARWERRQQRRSHANPVNGIIFSIAIITLGGLFLMDNLGIVRFHDVARYWPVILIALGVVRLVDSHGTPSIVFGGILTAVGGLLLLDNLGIFYFDWRLFWPAVLIGVGVLSLLRTMEWQQRHDPGNPTNPPNPAAGPPPGPQNLDEWTVFGGGQRRIEVPDFRGGEVSAMFGGYEIDLRGAGLADGKATIDVNVMFGGAEIKIPQTWAADVRGSGMFGAFSDETRHPDPSTHPPSLTVTGSAMFGGVTVTN